MDSTKMLLDIDKKLRQSHFDAERAIKVEDIYGRWGMEYAFNVGPILSVIPLLISILMFLIFKRKRLLGATQKFILSNIIMNVFFTTTAATRDGLLGLFQMNYGFLEYSICSKMIISLRLQFYFVSTSMWLTSLMLLHQIILIGFPLKAKLYNALSFFCAFFLIHFIICSVISIISFPSFDPVPLVQEYKPGLPLKGINGCIIGTTVLLGDYVSPNTIVNFAVFMLVYAKILPFALNVISIVALIILLAKHIRTLSLMVHNVTGRRINYLILMKVNICLGMSFILQELPVIVMIIIQYSYIELHDLDFFYKYQGISFTLVSISFSLGKPIDLLIYSSLSKTFKEELKRFLFFSCKLNESNTENSTKITHYQQPRPRVRVEQSNSHRQNRESF